MATILSRKPGGTGGGGGGPPSGPAGGDLSGTYPNPDIAAGAVGTTELADDAVDTNAIQNNAVTAAKVAADVATQAELDAAIAALGIWQAYVPTLTASSVNPNLGTTPTQEGRYTQIGDMVVGWARIVFGTGGSVAAGTGDYRISLPVAPRNISTAACGSGYLRDASTGNKYGRTINLDSANQWCYMRADVDGTGSVVGAASPFTWATLDSIDLFFTYEAA